MQRDIRKMDYTNEKNVINLDVLVLSPEEYSLYNKVFKKALEARGMLSQPEFVRDVDRVIMSDSLNSVEFLIKTVQEDRDYKQAVTDKKEEEDKQVIVDSDKRKLLTNITGMSLKSEKEKRRDEEEQQKGKQKQNQQ